MTILLLYLAGATVGLLAVLLVLLGNPGNMGYCIACFIRDITGALGFHRAEVVQYMRPEILAMILGAFVSAFLFREFKSTGGSSFLVRFFLGMLMMAGALVFLGCPLRMILRLAGGDLNALVALPGYVLGIWVGVQFLKRGFTLGRSSGQPAYNAYLTPLATASLILGALFMPFLFFSSSQGPGSQYAPFLAAGGAGLLVGVLAQRSRLCTMGAVRDIILFRDFHLFTGIAAVFITALLGSILAGFFNFGFADQPVAHAAGLWNFLGLGVVGLAAVLAGGCPLRQLVMAGEGSSDAALTVLGMIFGAALMHNFNLAASPAGVSLPGQAVVVLAWILALLLAFAGTCNISPGKAKMNVGGKF